MIEVLVNAYAKRQHHPAWRHSTVFTGLRPNAALPRTVEEKFLWRKIFDHDPRFVEITDKLAVKEFVAARAPGLDIAPVLWTGTDLADLPRDLIGDGAVLKANNGSGRNVLLTSPDFDLDTLRDKTRTWARIYGAGLDEWAYGEIEPRIYLEKLIPGAAEPGYAELVLYCFGGRVLSCVQFLYSGYDTSETANLTRLLAGGPGKDRRVIHTIDGPPAAWGDDTASPATHADFTGLEPALHFARTLSRGFDMVRVDLHRSGGRYGFSEMTLYPYAGGIKQNEGLDDFSDAAFQDLRAQAAAMWDLRDTWFLTTPQPGWRGVYANWLRRRLDRDAAAHTAPAGAQHLSDAR